MTRSATSHRPSTVNKPPETLLLPCLLDGGAYARTLYFCGVYLLGELTQPQATAGANRAHPASRSRSGLLSATTRSGQGGLTQTKRPPRKPGRFILGTSWSSPAGCGCRYP